MLTFPIAPFKYVVSIDIVKDTFVACFGLIEASQHLWFGKQDSLANTATGFEELLTWIARPPARRARPRPTGLS